MDSTSQEGMSKTPTDSGDAQKVSQDLGHVADLSTNKSSSTSSNVDPRKIIAGTAGALVLVGLCVGLAVPLSNQSKIGRLMILEKAFVYAMTGRKRGRPTNP